ncbi:MAG TPA: hypothetical protein VIG72_11170 [Pontibacter sp.]
MKKYLCLLLFLVLSVVANAQNNTLAALNQQQTDTMKTGMVVLGAWALLNILIGSFRLMKATRSKRYFFQMNIYWNIVNMLIASVALYLLLTANAAAPALSESIAQHSWFKKILYLNMGLDVAYLMTGVWLQERSRYSPKTEQLEGWGQAVVLQGLFLLLLDVVLTILLENQAPAFYSLMP